MIKEALEYLLELKRPEIVEVENKKYSTIGLNEIKEAKFPTLYVSNLSSLVNYIIKDPDTIDKNIIINILSPTKVIVESESYGEFKQRETYVDVNYSNLLPEIYFDRFMNIENFIVNLKSKFVYTEDLEKIIKIIGNITDENVTTYNDDGFTQKVTTKTGIARVGEVALPPRIKLKPYRTFLEVEQPESEFILRAKKENDGIKFALFEADGGAWKKQAINSVSMYLDEKLVQCKNIIILY